MAQKDLENRITQTLVIQDRGKLSVTGVSDIETFDERETVLYTALGRLLVRGREMKMERLSVDEGALVIHGQIDAVEYSEMRGKSIFGKLFG